MRRAHAVARAIAYIYFSLVAGLLAAELLVLVLELSHTGTGVNLTGHSDGVAWIVGSLFVLGLLVFGQYGQFGRPIRLLKWVPLCLLATFLAALGLVATGP
jgi:hypothetical protein